MDLGKIKIWMGKKAEEIALFSAVSRKFSLLPAVLFFSILGLGTTLRAGEGLTGLSGSHIWRNDVNPSGSSAPWTSASHKLFFDITPYETTVPDAGTKKDFAGLGNLIAHPDAVTDLTGFNSDAGQISLTWTAPFIMDGYIGASGSYLVKWSSYSPILSEEIYESTTTYDQNWTPLAPGVLENAHTLTGLPLGVRIYVAIKAQDAAGNRAYLSSGPLCWQGVFIASFPAVATNVTGLALSTDTIKWSWTDNATNENGYRVVAASGGAISPNLPADTTYFVQSGLLGPNTYFAVIIQNYIGSNITPTAATGHYTLAATASEPGIYQLSPSTIALRWGESGNPAAFTRYDVDVSSDGGFGTVSSSSVTAVTTTTLNGFLPNTSYYYRIYSLNGDQAPSSPTASVTTVTLADVPVFSSFTVSLSSFAVSWSSHSNPSDTLYTLRFSTISTFDLYTETSTYDLTVSSRGLLYNTTYYVWGRAANRMGLPTLFADFGSTVTRAASPALAGYSVGESSVTITLDANGNNAGTRLEVSTHPSFLVGVTTAGINEGRIIVSTWVLNGLAANTTYSVYARAVSFTGLASSTTLLVTTPTFVAVPSTLTFAAADVGPSSITFHWSANGNSTGTFFSVDVSADSGFATYDSSQTYLLSLASASLLPNVTYYYRVRARNWGGVWSGYSLKGATVTLARAPNWDGFAVYTTSAGVLLEANGNNAGVIYRAVVSSDGFRSVAFSSAGKSLALNLDGLTANTTYLIGAEALNWAGAVSSRTLVASTAALPAVPGSTSFLSVSRGTATITWGNGGNQLAPPTSYQVQVSTWAGFAGTVTSSTTFLLQMSTGGLLSNVTYYFRVRAFGRFGDVSDFNPTEFVGIGPNAPALVNFTVYETSIAVVLNGNENNPGTPIIVTTGSFEASSSSQAPLGSGNLNFVLNGLTPNTTYLIQTLAGGIITSTVTPIADTATFAMYPGLTAATMVGASSITINWGPNGNPLLPSTSYEVQISTWASFSEVITSSVTFDISASTTGLVAGTSYYFRVRAFNRLAGVSSFNALFSTVTLPAIPDVGISSQVFLSSMVFNWGLSGAGGTNPAGTQFVLERSTVESFSPLAGQSDWTTALSSAPENLAYNTTQYFRLKARNWIGIESPYSQLFATPTLAQVPATSSFGSIQVTSMTLILADPAAAGNPPGTEMLIQNVESGNFLQAPADSTATLGAAPVWLPYIQWGGASGTGNTELLPNTSYTYRVMARNWLGRESVYSVTVNSVTLAAKPAAGGLTQMVISTVSLNWNNPLNNPADTLYEMQASTLPQYAVYTASITPLLNSTLALLHNASYYFQVRGISRMNLKTDWVGLGSTVTYAQPVSTNAGKPSFVDNVFVSSALFSWAYPSGNPSGTRYLLELSTDNFQTVQKSSVTVLNSVLMKPLRPGTTYQLRVAVLNRVEMRTEPVGVQSFAMGMVQSLEYQVGGTSITVIWDGNVAPAGSEFRVQIASVVAGGSTSTFVAQAWTADISSWTFTGLSTNTQHVFQVDWREPPDTAEIFMVSGATRTFATPPQTPGGSTLSFDQTTLIVNPASNRTEEPNDTQFAIYVNAPGTVQNQKYVPAPTGGNSNMNNGSDSAVWLTYSQWGGTSGIVVSNLASGTIYEFKVKARNGNNVETDFSTGRSFILFPTSPKIVWQTGLAENSWINITVTSFTARNSSHYHYQFTQNETVTLPDSGDNTAGFGPGFVNLEVVTVTATAQGPWFFYVTGDSYGFGTPPNQSHSSLGNSKFKVNVDTTAPAIASLAAQFAPGDNTPVADDADTTHREPYFTWSSPIGNVLTESPIVGYSVVFASGTDPGDAAVPEVVTTTGTGAYFPGARTSGTYYFRVKAKDTAGNWGSSRLFTYRYLEDVVRPKGTVEPLSPVKAVDGRYLSVPASSVTVQISFDEDMKSDTLISTQNARLRRIRNNLSATLDESVQVTLSYQAGSRILNIYTPNGLAKGSRYELVVGTGATDLGGNPISSITVYFETALDKDSWNRLIGMDGETVIEIPAGALREDASVSDVVVQGGVKGSPAAVVHGPQYASQEAIQIANDRVKSMLGNYAQPVSVREFNAITVAGARISDNFNAAVNVSIPYLDEDNDGFVDGTNPPVRVKTLGIYVLNEKTQTWQKVPGAQVDASRKLVTAGVRHFSVYAVMGAPDRDVNPAYAYPVPFDTRLGHRDIKFTYLPTDGVIRVYSVTGELLKRIDFSNPVNGEVAWDVRDDKGEELGTDVYLYIIESGDNKKKGKLVIIR